MEPDLARAGQVGRDLDDGLDLAIGESGVGLRRIRIRRDHDVLVESLGGRLDRGRQRGRRRFDDADLGRLVVTEQQRRDDERADHDERGEGDAEDEAAAPSSFEHLAPGDEPDAAPAGHHATSRSVELSGATASMNSSDSFGAW